MTYKRATTTVVNRGYTYDALARPVTRTTARKGTIRNDAFTYNSRSELAATTLGTDAYGYGYDNIGNRKTAQELAEELTYASNNLNQYTSITRSTLNSSPSTLEEPFVPAYDANGNQTLVKTATGLWTVQYDANNRPVSFTKAEAESTTVVECGYDYMGRRYMKKVTVNGTVALHHRYIYWGYLQVACCDLKRSAHPCLWLITWDPTDPVATRPLAIQKDGTWYCYGHDITKNVWEIFGSSGYIRTAYDYTPYGGVVEEGDVAQPIQWSSEMYDDELALVYYNYRHYNPTDGRWISRDPIAEQERRSLYQYMGNHPYRGADFLGMVDNWIQINIPPNNIPIRVNCATPDPKKPGEKPNPCTKKYLTEATGKEKQTCETILQESRENEKVKKLMEEMQKAGCEIPPITCKCCEGSCKGAGAWHFFDEIAICANSSPDGASIISYVLHELTHRKQQCRNAPANTCEDVFKKEIEAYKAAGKSFADAVEGAVWSSCYILKCTQRDLTPEFIQNIYKYYQSL